MRELPHPRVPAPSRPRRLTPTDHTGQDRTCPTSERRTVFYTPHQITGDPARDALIGALYAVEAREGERRGWDQPPRLFTAHLPAIDAGAVELRPVPGPAWKRGLPNPVDDLIATVAHVLRGTPPPADLPHLPYRDAPDHIAAVVLLCESWMADPAHLTDDDRARQAAGQRVLHANPHRIEMRQAIAADINGHGYIAARVRDRDPEPPDLTAPEAMHAPAGQGPGRALRALHGLAYAARTAGWPHPAN